MNIDKHREAYKTIGEVTRELDLIDKKTGILVDITNKNPVKFSKALEKLLTDTELRYNMGIEAENFILTERSLETTADKLNIILKLVSDNYKLR